MKQHLGGDTSLNIPVIDQTQADYQAILKERFVTINKAHFVLHIYWCFRLCPKFNLEGKIVNLSPENYIIFKAAVDKCSLEMVFNGFITEEDPASLIEKHQKIVDLFRSIFGITLTKGDNDYLESLQFN
jgi:hypothetical protein